MPALFPKWTNTAFRLGIAAAALLLPGTVVGLMFYVRSPWNTSQFEPVEQPVEFDHRHHVIDDQIACLYCHRGAETSRYAGIPSTDVCMGCHSQVWNDSPLLEEVRRSYFSNRPIAWNRVHDLPDFVYFDHAVHVQDGVRCATCHGRVETMARVYQVAPLTMGWCLDCHRQVEVGRLERGQQQADLGSTSMWGATVRASLPGAALERHQVTRLTTCTACHR
jgi:Cytochrome c7 and related cytochrome c